MNSLLKKIIRSKKSGKKLLALLIDPEKFSKNSIKICEKHRPDFIFLGGSTVTSKDFNHAIKSIKKISSLPLVLFPGNEKQISSRADAILLLSLLSGRNPEFLIGKQIKSAFAVKKSGLAVISTSYILLGSDQTSAVARVSGTHGLPYNQPILILSTALASQQLGFQCVYLEAGSGSKKIVPAAIIKKTSKLISIPLIVGGGINTIAKANNAWKNGADIVVVGNAAERNPELIRYFCEARNELNKFTA